MSIKTITLLSIIFLFGKISSAQTGKNLVSGTNKTAQGNFHLVKDIDTTTSSSPYNFDYTYASGFCSMNGIVYYAADDGVHGIELWRSNGTKSGTRLVKDINPGPGSGNALNITKFKGKIYFSAFTEATGWELYQSDGTDTGTHLIKDLEGGPESSSPARFAAVNENLFFVTYYNPNSFIKSLWKTDGTENGTTKIMDFNSSSITQLTNASNLLFFVAYNSQVGRELWRSDGTSAGTYIVRNINPSTSFDNGPANLTAYGNLLYFSVDSSYYRYLYQSDGTSAGTRIVPNHNGITVAQPRGFPGNQDQPFAIANGSLFFAGYSSSSTGVDLYKYNLKGNKGITLVKDMFPGSYQSDLFTESIRSLNDTIYFIVPDSNGVHSQLWRSAGNSFNTTAIKTLPGLATTNNLYSLGKNLYFSCSSSTNGNEPWISNGTSAGTKLLMDINPGSFSSDPACFTLVGSQVYFGAFSSSNGRELWATNSDMNTNMVKDVNVSSTQSGFFASDGDAIALDSQHLVFSAYQPSTGHEIWVSDGTKSGTSLIKQLRGKDTSSFWRFYDSKKGKAYFIASSPENYQSIYVTDGTAAGTRKLISIPSRYDYFDDVKVSDNGIVFYSIHGFDTIPKGLWCTNVNGVNTLIGPGVFEFAVAGNFCYFSTNNSTYGKELWKSDGSSSGTVMVTDLNPGLSSSNPVNFIPYEKKILFSAQKGFDGGLYISDGTEAGTILLKGNTSISSYYGSAILNGQIYFAGADGNSSYGGELYRTDGTPGGTVLVKDINPESESSNPQNFITAGSTVYFMADDGVNGLELWKTNGSTNSTSMLKNITTGYVTPDVHDLSAVGNNLYFLDSSTLWKSDGTTEGTQKVSDEGLASTIAINYIIGVGNQLYLSDSTYKRGYELYKSDPVQGISQGINLSSATKEKIDQSLIAQLMGNPISNKLDINIISPKVQYLRISVINVSGVPVTSRSYNVSKGDNFLSFDAENWISGLYLIKISSDEGTVTLKAVK